MKIRVDERLLEEAERFRFRFRCDDCAHFDGARCGEGWNADEHRAPLAPNRVLVLCKEFEMT